MAGIPTGKTRRGMRAHMSGEAAEGIALRAYLAAGYRELARRWRGPGGEIDLILGRADEVVFAEVKFAPTHEQAAARLSPAQIQRIQISAAAFLDTQPKGALTPARFDAALVDPLGRVQILENAFGQG